jgi:hypothetical protein
MDVRRHVTVATDLARASPVLVQLANSTFIAQIAISSSQMPTVLMLIGGKLILRRRDLNMTVEHNDSTDLFVLKSNAAATVWA